jgi:hypothetical protein
MINQKSMLLFKYFRLFFSKKAHDNKILRLSSIFDIISFLKKIII